MSTVNLSRFTVNEHSYRRAREIVNNKTQNNTTGARKTANDVLSSIREMKPGWNVGTTTANWGEGVRNLQISQSVLQRMADDPEAMVEFKAFILDLEYVAQEMEAWQEENPGYSLQVNFNLAEQQTLQATMTIRTLLGAETRSNMELSGERTTWADTINEKLNQMREGRSEEADGSRSWQA